MKKFIFVIFIFLTLFAVQLNAEINSEQIEQPNETQLEIKYDRINIEQIDVADSNIQTDYPTAVIEFEKSLLSTLESSNHFKEITKQSGLGENTQDVLFVKCKITSIKIVSTAKRIFIGALAGKSHMNIDVNLIDGKTGKVLREKVISSSNDEVAAGFTFAATDRGLTGDMGMIVAQYIIAVTK